MGNFLKEDVSLVDIFNVATGLTKFATDTTSETTPKRAEYSYSSIAKSASKLIAVFPVITSRTVSPETAQRVAKYIEQISCQFIMLGMQAANIDTAESGIEYLRKFHQNLDIGGNGVDAVIGTVDSWLQAFDAYSETALIDEDSYNNIRYSDMLESDKDLFIKAKDMKELLEMMKHNEHLEFYDTSLNPISINDYSIDERYNGNYGVSIKVLNEKSKKSGSGGNGSSSGNNGNGSNNNGNNNGGNGSGNGGNNNGHSSRNNNMPHFSRYRNDQPRTPRINYDSGHNVCILKDQDIKKMNDAVNSLLVVRFYKQNSTGVSDIATEFIIGVKSKVIGVQSGEVLRRIMNDNKDGQKFIKFMRTITGELKASDVLFGLSRIKDDVNSCKIKGAYGDTWNLLANRARAAKERVRNGQRNDFSAITTVVISKYDADELYKEENLDIEDPRNAYHFMQSYNLMAFAIVDDATESLKVLFDNDSKAFEELAYRTLERETQDGTYKKLINLLAASK